jgi:phosphopantetheinyl transferase (holo-ACP synthase)
LLARQHFISPVSCIVFVQLGIEEVKVSISHAAEVAVAQAIAR